jgi:hypothetical protein
MERTLTRRFAIAEALPRRLAAEGGLCLSRKRERCTKLVAIAQPLTKAGCIFGLLFAHKRN